MSEKNVKSRSKVSLIAIENELAFSLREVWAWFKIPALPFEFRDGEALESAARRIDTAFASLISSADKSLECHLITTNKPFDTENWMSKLQEQTEKWGPTSYFKEFSENMRIHVENSEFRVREVYLGIHLGKRGTQDFGSSPLTYLSNFFTSLITVPDTQISEKELDYWRDKSKEYKRTLASGHLKAIPASANEIARLVKKSVFPSMQVPDVTYSPKENWGAGEIINLVDSYMEEKSKFLKFVQTNEDGYEIEGYRATVCFSRFPDVLEFPQQEPWVHFSAVLPFPSDIYSRFTIEPAAKVKRDVNKKAKEALDQAKNAGSETSLETQEQLQLVESLEYDLARHREPWVYGRHRAVIEAPTEDELRSRVSQFREHYKNLGIDVVWPSGDQLDLFLESHPADKVRLSSYYQRHGLSILSGGMPMGAGTVGDRVERQRGKEKGWVGPFLGKTTSRVEEIVCLSIHSAIARNNPPGVVITGSPGNGKSFCAFTITYQMALAGVWTIYIDPKADALPMADLRGLENVRAFDLREGSDGLLDPFSLGKDLADKRLLAVETITRLIGGKFNAMEVTAMNEAVKEVSLEEEPSLNKVVDLLFADTTNPDARSLGSRLDFIRYLEFASLCFSPQKVVEFKPDEGLTIVTLLGIDLPPAELEADDYSISNKLAVSVMFLLTYFTRQLMLSLDKNHPKAVVIDEAWAVTGTKAGAKLASELVRMGRSHNTGVIFISQNANDFMDQGFTNSVSIKLAFKATSPDEIDAVTKFFNLENNEGNRDAIRELTTGECLMQDVDGRIAMVQVEAWEQEQLTAYDTNPETRDKEVSAN